MTIEWTRDISYCIGLIATDGCLYSDGRHLCFTSKDKDLIHLFMEIMKIRGKIGKTVSGQTGSMTHRIQWGDKHLHEYLTTIGITPNKSKTIQEVLIPEQYFFDFVRGIFDGDGSFYSYHDKRYGTFLWYVTFNSASKQHILWLQAMISEKIGVTGHISKARTSSVYSLRYGKKEGLQIINKMYYSSHVPCLKRKLIKIQDAQVVKLVDTQP